MNRFEKQTMTISSSILLVLSMSVAASAFAPASTISNSPVIALYSTSSSTLNEESRRQVLLGSILPAVTAATTAGWVFTPEPASARTSGAADTTKSAPDFVQKYEDFTPSPEGWQYKDVKVGAGDSKLEVGDRAVYDWSGYTIGYFGRPFEAKG